MGNYYSYKRISTKEERALQTFSRQDKALAKYAKEHNLEFFGEFMEDASGKSFTNRKQWQKLEKGLRAGDTVVFKDISRFTREFEAGYSKYMELIEKGINLIFLDNPTVSSDYIRTMLKVADENPNRIASISLKNTVQLLLLVELDRVEKEREILVKRIKDGIAASNKKSGRPIGHLDKLTPALETDINLFLKDRSIKQVDLMRRHNLSRNTLKKYIELVKNNKL